MLRTFVYAAAFVALSAGAASAQLRGVVRDGAGIPVAGATVEAWAGLRRIDSTLSDRAGDFALDSARAATATGIVVRHIGFQRLAVPVTPSDRVLQLTLVPEPVALRGITATVLTRSCPNRDDPVARALWAAAIARYSFADTVVFHSLASFHEAQVRREDIDGVGEDGGTRGWSAGGTRAWGLWRRQIRAGGYAVRLQSGFGNQYALWQYAPLEMVFTQHFADPLFGELHTLSIAVTGTGQTTIRFCPRRETPRGRPDIQGTLTLAPDGVLLGAEWKYLTPNPEEDAGGEVEFILPQASARWILLPERSRFWRLTNGGRYHVEFKAFEEWRLFPGSEAPPVPAEISSPLPGQPHGLQGRSRS